MNIEIKNCNNIDTGNLKIDTGKLNVKYAINGTGKSTVAKALEAFIKHDDIKIKELLPFKYYDKDKCMKPEMTGVEGFKSIEVFDEKYVSNYIFQPNELIQNSFEIFIKNEDYDQNEKEIESLLQDVNMTFKNHPELDGLISSFQNFIDGFGKSQSGYSKSGEIEKGIGQGNKIYNIPSDLKVYKNFLTGGNTLKWLKWQQEGRDYLQNDAICPYCTSHINEDMLRIISRVSDEFTPNYVSKLNKMLNVFDELNPYFANNVKNTIKEISQNSLNISEDQKNFLIKVRVESEGFLKKLINLKNIGFHTLKYSEKIANELIGYKINLSCYPYFDSEETAKKVNIINATLDNLLEKAEILQKEINAQKNKIKDTIDEYKKEINDFLYYAGYKYKVSIEYDDVNNYHLVLKHRDTSSNIESASEHLSYGERNAFALALFMYQVLRSNPDIVILDDPISSFDGNKKFAILNMLLLGEKSLKNRTVLLLTHDFSTVIDVLKNIKNLQPLPNVSFLTTKEGIIFEKTISKNDIQPFNKIAKGKILSDIEVLNKLVYLRRLEEIENKSSLSYQLLSNLFHKREEPIWKNYGCENKKKKEKMSADEIKSAEEEIQQLIPEFNYNEQLDKIKDNNYLKELYLKSNSNYEKLQLYRLTNNENHDNNVIRNFINKTFHIENDYIFQLNPTDYDTVPQYIIDECDKEMMSSNR